MARHRAHGAFNKLLTGNSHREVNRLLDLPALFLGRRHRILFHDPFTAPALGALAAWCAGKSPTSGALAGWLHIILDWCGSWVGRQGGRHLRPIMRYGGEIMFHLVRDGSGRPLWDHERVTLEDGDHRVFARHDDLPAEGVPAEVRAEVEALAAGRWAPPAGDALAQALHRKAIAEAERDAAIAEAEAVQAKIASGHLRREVEAKVRGTRLPQLFWMGALGYFVGTVAGNVSGAGVGVTILLGIAGAWFAVWFRLHRVSVEARLLEAQAEREAQRRAYEERRAATVPADQEREQAGH